MNTPVIISPVTQTSHKKLQILFEIAMYVNSFYFPLSPDGDRVYC